LGTGSKNLAFSSYLNKAKKAKYMLELSKKILEKVSFDHSLFRKELRKSLKWIDPKERMALKAWCLATFGAGYSDIVTEVFESSISASL